MLNLNPFELYLFLAVPKHLIDIFSHVYFKRRRIGGDTELNVQFVLHIQLLLYYKKRLKSIHICVFSLSPVSLYS